MKRLPSHPLHSRLQDLTKNRIKRQSPNHLIKALQKKKHGGSLPAKNLPVEPLQDVDEWSQDTPDIILDILGIGTKENHSDPELKRLTLETLNRDYPSTT